MVVAILGTGVPRLACLQPTAWLEWWPSMAHLHQRKLKTLARGQASWGRRCKASSGAASPGMLARRRRDQGKGTSRGARDSSRDDRDQASAGLCSVLVSSLVQRGQAQARSTKASSKGYHFGATRPRPAEAAGQRSPWSPRRCHRQCLWQPKTNFSQDNLY